MGIKQAINKIARIDKSAGVFDVFKGYGDFEARLAKRDPDEIANSMLYKTQDAYKKDGNTSGKNSIKTRENNDRRQKIVSRKNRKGFLNIPRTISKRTFQNIQKPNN